MSDNDGPSVSDNEGPIVYNVVSNVLPENSGMVEVVRTKTETAERVVVTATPVEGYQFVDWTINGVSENTIVNDNVVEFDMPTNEVTITANFEEIEIIEDEELGIRVEGVFTYVYTGSAIKPVLTVYDGETLLTEGVDYTVSYKNNLNTYYIFDGELGFNPKKAPTAILKMKGNYSGTKNIYFIIEQANINDCQGYILDIVLSYTGKNQKVTQKLMMNGKNLTAKDYKVERIGTNSNVVKESGDYRFRVIGTGNYCDFFDIAVKVVEDKNVIPMSKVNVSNVVNKAFEGVEIKQDFKVKYKNDIPVIKEEFVYEYRNNDYVGIAELVLRGTGNDADGDGITYLGQKVITYKITGTNISKAKVQLVEKDYTFTNDEIKPKFEVFMGEEELIADTHYFTSVTNNIKKGKATVTITGNPEEGFTGTKKFTFNIKAELVNNLNVQFVNGQTSYKLTKNGAKPNIEVYSGGYLLTEGVDYTVSYKNNKAVYTVSENSVEVNAKKAPTITIKGKGNFTGSKTLQYDIYAAPLTAENGIKVVVADKVVSTKAGGYVQKVTVYDADGSKLTTKDYDSKNITYTLLSMEEGKEDLVLDKKAVVPAGSVIKVTVQGKGLYEGGAVTAIYRIIEKSQDISKVKATIVNQNYTGDEITITSMSQFKDGKVTLKVGSETKELVLGKDFVVVEDSYVGNVNRGTAKVTIKGIGEFGGNKTLNFKIVQRSITNVWGGFVDTFFE